MGKREDRGEGRGMLKGKERREGNREKTRGMGRKLKVKKKGGKGLNK